MTQKLCLFDAYGTLFDVHSAVARHRALVGPHADQLSALWRSKQLEYTWVRSLMGAYLNFEQVTADALDFAAHVCGGLAPPARSALLEAYCSLDAYPDVRPALTALRAQGAKTAILSNGTSAMLASAVAAAALGDCLDAVLSVDELRLYKTAPQVYAMACERLGTVAAETTFVSSNRWDVAGAARFGFRAIWVNRTAQPDEYADCPPAAIHNSLDGLATLAD